MDKRIDLDDMVAQLSVGTTLAFGGGGMQRKPMAAAKAIARKGLQGIHAAVFLGGPEIDLLAGTGVIGTLRFAYVGFDLFGLSPNFRKMRESGKLRIVEYSEGTAIAAFDAGAKRLPFMPTRFGLGTDILRTSTSPFVLFTCPVSGEPLIAVPAITPDVTFIHVNLADRHGNGLIIGDPFIDPVMARASKKVYLTAEKVVDRLPSNHPSRSTIISRMWVDGVCEVPNGAGFTGLYPDYPIGVSEVAEYMANATNNEWLSQYINN